MAGPLAGIKLIEFAGIGPGPMAAMMLADMGATVLRIERDVATGLGIERPLKYNVLLRNRRAIALNLKKPDALELAFKLIEGADGVLEGYRPGVMERIGLGPDACLARNPRLVYGRMTGWGQTGPLATSAGHDLNYIAVTGALHSMGRKDAAPSIPLNIVGDYAGGGCFLAFGILCALLEAQRSGRGQVVDAAIVDGTAYLMANFHGLAAAGIMTNDRGTNIVDSGSFFYEVYQCADGKWISIAPIEPKFYLQLLELLNLSPTEMPPQSDRDRWPEGKETFARIFRERTQSEWCALLENTDCCYAPVLSLSEAPSHDHMIARETYLDVDGVVQPGPAPRFSRSAPLPPTGPEAPSEDTISEILAEWLPPSDVAHAMGADLK